MYGKAKRYPYFESEKEEKKPKKGLIILLLVLFLALLLSPFIFREGGMLIVEADATVHKEVGDTVSFYAKVKNTGSITTVYIVKAYYRENKVSPGSWIYVSSTTVSLDAGETSSDLLVGTLEATGEMAGKVYDARFTLETDSGRLLDEKVINKAFDVSQKIAGKLTNVWVG